MRLIGVEYLFPFLSFHSSSFSDTIVVICVRGRIDEWNEFPCAISMSEKEGFCRGEEKEGGTAICGVSKRLGSIILYSFSKSNQVLLIKHNTLTCILLATVLSREFFVLVIVGLSRYSTWYVVATM